MIRRLFGMLFTLFLAIGYIPIYLGYGSKAMDARKKLGRDKLDAFASLVLTAVIVFWVVRLVILLRGYAPKQWETAVVCGLPGLYVLWFIAARINAKRCIRAAQKLEQDTKAAADTSGSASILTDEGREITITFKQVGSESSQSDADALAKLLGVDAAGKEESGEPEEPLTESYCLGSHHVSSSDMHGMPVHIGMTVSYDAEKHAVIYAHWSTQDPEVKEEYPVPETVRTKRALENFVQSETPIPCVWMY